MLARLPLRVRLAIGFAAGLSVVLVLAGAFVYLQVSDDLDQALDASLTARADDLRTLVETSAPASVDLGGVRAGEEESTFTEIVSADGSVIESTLPPTEQILSPDQLGLAARGVIVLDGIEVEGIEGESRVLAAPLDGAEGALIAVVGATTSDQEEALSGIRRAFALGGPIALLLASGIGYLLGARALAPVEVMRSRAREITLEEPGERLPTPPAADELRSLSETLNEMLDRVEGALHRERVFVSDASHELRTPLAILKSEIELVQRTGGSKAELEAALDSAGEEVEHLVRLAEDLLIIARSEQGRLPIRREDVDVDLLLQRVAGRFEAAATESGRSILLDAGGLGDRMLDPRRIEQALGNVLDNALRYGEGPIAVTASAQSDDLMLEVSDDGPGFREDFVGEAFERFTQVDSGRVDVGTGLGLAIVRAIARAHGGDATIGGAGNGATVTIVLHAPVVEGAIGAVK